jgi:hypothetical protein
MFPKTCPVCKHESIDYDDRFVFCTNCTAYRSKIAWYKRPVVWALQRTGWWWRLIIVAIFFVFLWQNWHDPWFAVKRLDNPFSALDMGIHELGHALFQFFGEFMHIAGGSLFQCLFPIITFFGFLQIRYYFAAAMCFCWLGLNFFDVATYAADAQARLLPVATGLAGLGLPHDATTYDAGHDWYQLLLRTNNLQYDQAIAGFLRIAATVVTFVGIALGLALIAIMFVTFIRRLRTSSL